MKALLLNLSLLVFLSIIGCKEEEIIIDYASIEKEMEELKGIDAKRNYLETIFEEDQKVRGIHGSEIMLNYGRHSKEYKAYVNQQITQDAVNLAKVETYFKAFGHPKFEEVGEIATITPSVVIHHAQTYEDRERNFEILYKAYLQGDLDDGAISMLLGRMYRIKNRERFEMKSPFKSAEEINQLIKELNLEKKKANAEQSVSRQ